MATQLTEIKLDRVSMVDEGANPHADILLMKRKNDQPCKKQKPGCMGPPGSCEECMAEDKSAKAAKKGAQMAEDLATVQAELAKAKADSDAAIAALTKRLDDQAAEAATVKADLAKAKADAEANAAKATEFEKRANEEREARELTECIAIGKSKFGMLPLAEEAKGKLIKTLKQKLKTEEYAEVEKLFLAHDAALKQLGNPPGVTGGSGEGSAYGKLQSLAKALAAKDGITVEKAMLVVSAANPELCAEIRSERRTN